MSELQLTRNDISELRDLGRSAATRYETQSVLVEGSRSISGAWSSGAKFRYILTTDLQKTLSREYGCEVIEIDEKTSKKVATTLNPQSEIAICEMPLLDVALLERKPLTDQSIFLLDGINDPGNLGTIFRSASAFSIGAVLLLGGCDPYNPKVVRSSAGTIFACKIASLEEYQLGESISQRPIYRAQANSKNQLDEMKFEDDVVFAFGSEANGFQTCYIQENSTPVSIKMAENCESLNVAMTATIVAYQLAANT